ncbi:acyl carrier protein [Streptomyces sp. NPDC088146]|uniref:acyl carrier protein n=1 Tax=Streptomyces sp. NPDC088146 TaxID=3365829 RepID=UPI0038297157
MSDSAVGKAAASLSEEELASWLKERIAGHVELPADEIRTDVVFASYGLDSVYAFVVIAGIEDHLGIRACADRRVGHPGSEAGTGLCDHRVATLCDHWGDLCPSFQHG